MKPNDPDSTITELHRIREEIAAKFDGDLFAINADARARMEKFGRKIVRRSSPPQRVRKTQEAAPSAATEG